MQTQKRSGPNAGQGSFSLESLPGTRCRECDSEEGRPGAISGKMRDVMEFTSGCQVESTWQLFQSVLVLLSPLEIHNNYSANTGKNIIQGLFYFKNKLLELSINS